MSLAGEAAKIDSDPWSGESNTTNDSKAFQATFTVDLPCSIPAEKEVFGHREIFHWFPGHG
jgi:hypothetical protein